MEFEEVLITRLKRKPPTYSLEYIGNDGKRYKAALIKAPKGEIGYHVALDANMGFSARTRAAAIRGFKELVDGNTEGQGATQGDREDAQDHVVFG